MMKCCIAGLLGLAALAPACVQAQAADIASFLEQSAALCLGEIAAGRAVAASSHDPQVQEFALQMVSDCRSQENELQGLAQKMGVSLPHSLDAENLREIGSMTSTPAKGLNGAYIHMQLQDDEKALGLVEQAVRSGDPGVHAFAEATLPLLKRHLEKDRRLSTFF
jgi:putative membrane protein